MGWRAVHNMQLSHGGGGGGDGAGAGRGKEVILWSARLDQASSRWSR